MVHVYNPLATLDICSSLQHAVRQLQREILIHVKLKLGARLDLHHVMGKEDAWEAAGRVVGLVPPRAPSTSGTPFTPLLTPVEQDGASLQFESSQDLVTFFHVKSVRNLAHQQGYFGCDWFVRFTRL